MLLGVAKRVVRRSVRKFGYEISKISAGPENPAYERIRPKAGYAPWNTDESFRDVYRQIKSNTLVDKYRCFELWALVEQSRKFHGALLEVGVWKGGTGALIAKKATLCGIDAPVYLCDTFSGVVKAGDQDSAYKGGEHADTNRGIVEMLVERMCLSNVRVLQGIFPDETGHLIAEPLFRFCHVDVDVYRSAEDILNWVWPRLVTGGIILYDDYGFQECPGIAKHVDQQKLLKDRIVIHNLNGHAIIIKMS